MSSFIGHSLVGGTIGWLAQPFPYKGKFAGVLWSGWLVIVAVIPDWDYVVPFLHPSAHDGLRITHSLLFALLLPSLTILILKFAHVTRETLRDSGLMLVLAGFSHMGMDLLVGVTALPLLWPVSDRLFRLPFGLLPSAGKVSLSNFYFYYNLLIELGVLLPLIACIFIRKYRISAQARWILSVILLVVSAGFMHWAYGLSR